MKLTDREKDLSEALSGTAKSALSVVPVLGQAIAGWDAYKKSSFDRNIKNTISFLKNKVDDFESLFSDDWVKSEEGQKFSRKVFDSAFDAQMEDKQELFINALINGIQNKQTTNLEKLKFVDMLRQLSRASLDILAELHKIYSGQVRRPNNSQRIDGSPNLSRDKIVEHLSKSYDPYLIESSYEELKSVGLFSPNINYFKQANGSYHAGNYMQEGNYAYTYFTCRFIEFITTKEKSKQLGDNKD